MVFRTKFELCHNAAESSEHRTTTAPLYEPLFNHSGENPKRDLEHPALTSGKHGVRSTLLYQKSMFFKDTNAKFHIFLKCCFSNFENDSPVRWNSWDRKTTLFDTEKLAFEVSDNFQNKFQQNLAEQIIFGKAPLSSGEQMIIWMGISRCLCCLRNAHRKTY